jgi:hypothetical protein
MCPDSKSWLKFLGILLGLCVVLYLLKYHNKSTLSTNPSCKELLALMTKLWLEHVWWTRNYIVVALLGLPDEGATLNRLLKNQVDIANAMAILYGSRAGDKLNNLLQEHILIAGEIVRSLREDSAGLRRVGVEKWYRNADDIAKALCELNPYLTYNAVKKQMYMHLELTTREIMGYQNGLWDENINAMDKVVEHAQSLATILTDAICKHKGL